MATLPNVMPLGWVAEQGSLALGPDIGADGLPLRPLLVIDTDVDRTPDRVERAAANLLHARAIVVAVTGQSTPLAPIAEIADISLARAPHGAHPSTETVWVSDPLQSLAELRLRVAANPVASLTLTWLLRGRAGPSITDALARESAAYSMLLAGREFRGWLAARPPARRIDGGERVRTSRTDDVLSLVLDRPHRRNAFDAAMRDALGDALAIAECDPSLTVVLTGAGPSFSAGGDLDEFGSATDVALAHLVRLENSPGAILHRIRDRATARIHGVCVGAGVEIPAFAGRVVARSDTEFSLPEIGMGLIPGAGGTVSVSRRIGRQRALWLAITGARLDAHTALAWGLVDAVE